MYKAGKLLITECLLFLSSSNDILKLQSHLTLSLAQNVLHTSMPLSISESLMYAKSLIFLGMWVLSAHGIKFEFLLSVCLLLI